MSLLNFPTQTQADENDVLLADVELLLDKYSAEQIVLAIAALSDANDFGVILPSYQKILDKQGK